MALFTMQLNFRSQRLLPGIMKLIGTDKDIHELLSWLTACQSKCCSAFLEKNKFENLKTESKLYYQQYISEEKLENNSLKMN